MKVGKSVIEKFVKYVVSLNNDALCANHMETIAGTFGSGDNNERIILYAVIDGYGNITVNVNIKNIITTHESQFGKFKIPSSIIAVDKAEDIAKMVADAIIDNKQ